MLRIEPITLGDLEAFRLFADREIGKGYYSSDEVNEIFQRSAKEDTTCSLLLRREDNSIAGIRISYPPGNWEHGKSKYLRPDLWPHPLDSTAYFQSLFLAKDVQGQGWGGRLSMESMKRLRALGAQGIVCHSWKESPHNSSTRYLLKLGFELVIEHPLYWAEVNYNCTRCLTPPCQCTAQEMYLDLERTHEHLLLA